MVKIFTKTIKIRMTKTTMIRMTMIRMTTTNTLTMTKLTFIHMTPTTLMMMFTHTTTLSQLIPMLNQMMINTFMIIMVPAITTMIEASTITNMIQISIKNNQMPDFLILSGVGLDNDEYLL
jgi:hypothetical protein